MNEYSYNWKIDGGWNHIRKRDDGYGEYWDGNVICPEGIVMVYVDVRENYRFVEFSTAREGRIWNYCFESKKAFTIRGIGVMARRWLKEFNSKKMMIE